LYFHFSLVFVLAESGGVSEELEGVVWVLFEGAPCVLFLVTGCCEGYDAVLFSFWWDRVEYAMLGGGCWGSGLWGLR
jgi:hypothetical protein